MTYATKIDGAWVALPFGQPVTVADATASYETVTGTWTDADRETFGVYGVPEPSAPPAGKVETSRVLGGTTRPKWVVTYGDASPVPEPEPEPAYRTLVSVARFKLMFGQEARVKMKLAQSYVPEDPSNPDMQKMLLKTNFDVFFESLADLQAAGDPVDISDPEVVGGVEFVRDVGFIDAEHAEAIKQGLPA